MAFEFALAHPEMVRDWHALSNTLVLLSVPDELSLTWLALDAGLAGLRAVTFHEPDLGGALTAVALEPAARRLVSHLPLLLKTRGGDTDDHVHRSRVSRDGAAGGPR